MSRNFIAVWCLTPQGRTLKKILEIIRDDTLSDEICFHKIEAIISLYEELGISTGSRHDFG